MDHEEIKEMMEVINGMFEVLINSNFTKNLAMLSRQYYNDLIAVGFSSDQAHQMVMKMDNPVKSK